MGGEYTDRPQVRYSRIGPTLLPLYLHILDNVFHWRRGRGDRRTNNVAISMLHDSP